MGRRVGRLLQQHRVDRGEDCGRGTDAEGQYTCRIYSMRFSQCRLYPLRAQDLAELGEECSYTFQAEPLRPAPNVEPEPALD